MAKRKSKDKMVSTFLEESSIHGLRYLVETRHPAARLAWLVAICACVGAASVIVYLNVASWEDSPVVVTTVKTAMAKVCCGDWPVSETLCQKNISIAGPASNANDHCMPTPAK